MVVVGHDLCGVFWRVPVCVLGVWAGWGVVSVRWAGRCRSWCGYGCGG